MYNNVWITPALFPIQSIPSINYWSDLTYIILLNTAVVLYVHLKLKHC